MNREEAIKNIKKLIGFSETLDESISTLFPELEEDEDEKIRKKIVSAMSYYRNDGCISEYEFDVCRNWLEKQKEPDGKRRKQMKTLPKDMDIECIELCNLLNSLPTVETMESCCGHCKDEYSIWFYCNSIAVLSRLARSVNKNYSDGKWELLVDTCDTKPYGLFWLHSKKPFASSEEMVKSVSALIDNIRYWFNDKFNKYFEE